IVSGLNSDVQRINTQLGAPGSQGGALPTQADLDKIASQLDDLDNTVAQLQAIPPDVLSSPFQLDLNNIAPSVPTFTEFYAPAVLVLLLQHLAVTLGALSMARVRILGLMDIFRASPVRPAEVVTGNYLSYGSLCCVAGGALLTVTVGALDVPVFG